MHRISKDIGAGIMFFALGAFFALYAWFTLRMGTAFRMGPGFFPVSVGVILALFGAAIFLRGLAQQAQGAMPVPWRAVVLIPATLAAFGLAVRPLGMVPALFLTCFAVAFASKRMTVRLAAATSAGMTAACVVLFVFLLDMSLPLLGDWFR